MSHTNLSQSWGKAVELVDCEYCKWRYLLSAEKQPDDCPHCYRAALSLGQSPEANSLSKVKKLFLNFTVTPQTLSERILDFARRIPFAPTDLVAENLQTRLQALYLPLWLVDSQVQAVWEAETGFNYDILSHKDEYHENTGWNSEEITKTRIQWEKRLGALIRTHNEISTSALQKPEELKALFEAYDLSKKQRYTPQAIASALVYLPTRPQNEAWLDVVPIIEETSSKECQQAASADHIRNFAWQPTFHNQQWTLLLLPVYASYYLDDQQQRQPLLLHGQSGLISGKRRASMQRAKRYSLLIVTIAIAIALFSLLAFMLSTAAAVLDAAMIGVYAALVVGVLALLPLLIVWYFNRTH
ncbi:MAG: hypothetical protein ACPGWR_28415 [Ardenticatenaceae bacterium]